MPNKKDEFMAGAACELHLMLCKENHGPQACQWWAGNWDDEVHKRYLRKAERLWNACGGNRENAWAAVVAIRD